MIIANERIKAIRIHRNMRSKDLASASGVSASEITGIEKRTRSPKTDTLQKIAAALQVRTSYLLGEINSDAPIEEALRHESLEIFQSGHALTPTQETTLRQICRGGAAPNSVEGWQKLVTNLSISGSPGFEQAANGSQVRR